MTALDTKLALDPRGEADFDLYPYTPSQSAGYAFVALFGIGAVVHLIMLVPLRSWFYIPFVLGCVGEAFGYYGRAWSSTNIRNGSPYLLQLMLILASAPLLSATIYMTLGRLIRSLDATHHAVLNPRWTTKLYVVIDIGSFVCQIMGSAMQTQGGADGAATGTTVVVGGLGTQLAAFVLFVLMAVVFHRRLEAEPTTTSLRTHVKWRKYMWALYAVSALVMIRSLFRFIEILEGPEGKAYGTEAYLYIFDAALMFAVVVIMAVLHPGLLFRVIRKADMIPIGDDDGGDFLLRRRNGK
ncbi:putative RTA1 domain protein [Stemphylium lycopersici]|nr:putative RTA1 domain protein [Stemphylium lycopersici]